jgi:hypothetical protein
MALHMREQLVRAVLAHAQGEIAKHRANVEVYLEHPATFALCFAISP